ncbi:unnamed protein product [Ilex paraguariensis]|uniref:Uncharacterized protein n=1 Tax=Ilex paraguariensis TaxID=185542 RepID=A0ABC8U9A0_9AQUA
MVNSELNSNGLGNSGTDVPIYHKQPPVAIKKTALRDVQNEKRSLKRSHEESSPFVDGRSITDAIKVHGTKRLTPDGPSNTHAASELLLNARRRFELELGRGRIQDSMGKYADCPQLKHCHMQQEISINQTQKGENNIHRVPVVTTNHMSSAMTFSYGGHSVPNSLGKPCKSLQAVETDCVKVTSELPHSIDCPLMDDQQRTERFIRLQNFLKQCDESNQNYTQMLLNFSPAELSRHAVELEKRAIQLTIEEGKEMQRVKALNVLGKSGLTNNPLQMTQKLQSKK